jgi:hypothetical protein
MATTTQGHVTLQTSEIKLSFCQGMRQQNPGDVDLRPGSMSGKIRKWLPVTAIALGCWPTILGFFQDLAQF